MAHNGSIEWTEKGCQNVTLMCQIWLQDQLCVQQIEVTGKIKRETETCDLEMLFY